MKKLMIICAALCAVAGAIVPAALAEWKPSGPIKMIIAFRAGGGADTQARLIAEGLEAKKGWKIIPEQVTGKGGLNAIKALKGQPTNGTTIAIVVTESLGYNMLASKAGKPTDVTPITTTAGAQMGIVALTSKGWKNLGDVLQAAKSGTKIRFGAMSQKLADLAYVIGKENNVEFNIVQVKGGKAVMNGLNAGDMDIGFVAGIQSKAVKAGTMVNLASALPGKLKVSPDAPMLSDFGVKFTGEAMFLFVGPKGMDQEARSAIAQAIGEVINDKSSKANGFISKAFGGPVAISGDKLDSIIKAGYDDAGALMSAAK